MTGQEYLVTHEGNGCDVDHEFAVFLYDYNWNKTIYAYSYKGQDGNAYNCDRNGREISDTVYYDIESEVRNNCIPVSILVTIGEGEPMTPGEAAEELRYCLEEGFNNTDYDNSGEWYYISNTYEKGIALREKPSKDSDFLCRLPYGTEFRVIYFEGVWGYSSVNGYSGWIDLNYADILDTDYYPYS